MCRKQGRPLLIVRLKAKLAKRVRRVRREVKRKSGRIRPKLPLLRATLKNQAKRLLLISKVATKEISLTPSRGNWTSDQIIKLLVLRVKTRNKAESLLIKKCQVKKSRSKIPTWWAAYPSKIKCSWSPRTRNLSPKRNRTVTAWPVYSKHKTGEAVPSFPDCEEETWSVLSRQEKLLPMLSTWTTSTRAKLTWTFSTIKVSQALHSSTRWRGAASRLTWTSTSRAGPKTEEEERGRWTTWRVSCCSTSIRILRGLQVLGQELISSVGSPSSRTKGLEVGSLTSKLFQTLTEWVACSTRCTTWVPANYGRVSRTLGLVCRDLGVASTL